MPPTDPRWLAMTPAMVDLELSHMLLDKIEAGDMKESFYDDEYDAYEKETLERDSRLSDIDDVNMGTGGIDRASSAHTTEAEEEMEIPFDQLDWNNAEEWEDEEPIEDE